jgi:PAS domain S-box-containing protein
VEQLAQKLVLERFTPPSVIINEFDEIQFVQGRTGKYLEITTGELSGAITKIAREGLKIALANAIRKAKTTRQEVRHQNLAVKINDHYEYTDLIVAPINARLAPQGWLLVVFQPGAGTQPQPDKTSAEDRPPDAISTVVELEKELAAKEDYLQSAIEELETTNEELKSANEEALSTNEELQSSNEELETSREELQSLNEELITTNSELQGKLQELSQVNSLLQNLFASTQIATIFLDRELCIFEFTPAISNIIDLRRSDFGRSIKQFTHNLAYDTLTEDAEAVLHNLVPKEVEVKTDAGQYFWMRIIPYRTVDDAIEGVVITFTDITEKKKQDEELEKYRHHLEQLVEERAKQLKKSRAMLARTEKLAHVGSWEWDIDRDAVTWSEELFRIFGLDPVQDPPSFAEHPKLYPPEAMEKLRSAVEAAINQGTPYEMEMQGRRGNGDLFYCHVRGYPEWGPDGRVARLFGSFQDITERKKAELALQEREATLRNIANNIPGLVLRYRLHPDGSDELVFLSEGVEDTYEISREQALEDVNLMWQMIHPDDLEEYSASVQASAEALSLWEREHRILLPDGRIKWLHGRAIPRKEEDGSVVWDTLGVDITERKETEMALAESKQFTDAIIGLIPTMLYIYDLETEQNIWTNDQHKDFFGGIVSKDSAELAKIELAEIAHPDDFARVVAKTEAMVVDKIQTNFEDLIRVSKNGQWRWLHLSVAVFKRNQAGDVTQVIGALIDVTGQKEAEQALKQSEQKYRQLFEFMPVGITVSDADGKIIDTNQTASQILGVQKTVHENRYVDDPAWQIIDKDGSLFPAEEYPSVRVLKGKQPVENVDIGIVKSPNEVTWINVSATPLVSDPNKVVVSYLDVTEKVRQEQKLTRALKEKEILLKEIYHRVKNNLQIISSMFNLQVSYLRGDEQSVKIFKDSQNRIRTMALIHEKLYQSRDLGQINAAEYIESLSRYLFTSFGSDVYKVEITQDINSIMLDVDVVVPCGLIINELVSNAIIHAFAGERSGKIVISLREHASNKLVLSVSNYGGLPFPSDLDFQESQSLGLELVNALVKQLDGEITLETGEKTTFTIIFPHPTPAYDQISTQPTV